MEGRDASTAALLRGVEGAHAQVGHVLRLVATVRGTERAERTVLVVVLVSLYLKALQVSTTFQRQNLARMHVPALHASKGSGGTLYSMHGQNVDALEAAASETAIASLHAQVAVASPRVIRQHSLPQYWVCPRSA